MKRAEYLKLVAEVYDRWPLGRWSDTMIEKWWFTFEPLSVEACVRAIKTLQRDGYGPYGPDPGTLLRHARAATPGGGRYAVGAHARRMAEMAENAASPEAASAAISACRKILAGGDMADEENGGENAAQGPLEQSKG